MTVSEPEQANDLQLMGGPGPRSVQLTDRQEALLRALSDSDVMVGNTTAVTMYLGAMTVLADESNPDRLALAAHGIRELIEKLPKYFGSSRMSGV